VCQEVFLSGVCETQCSETVLVLDQYEVVDIEQRPRTPILGLRLATFSAEQEIAAPSVGGGVRESIEVSSGVELTACKGKGRVERKSMLVSEPSLIILET
jgi:hypothetical protein